MVVQRQKGTVRETQTNNKNNNSSINTEQKMCRRWIKTRSARRACGEDMKMKRERKRQRRRRWRRNHMPTSVTMRINWTQRIFDGFVCNLFIYCVLSMIWHCDACKRLSLFCGPFYSFRIQAYALQKVEEKREQRSWGEMERERAIEWEQAITFTKM